MDESVKSLYDEICHKYFFFEKMKANQEFVYEARINYLRGRKDAIEDFFKEEKEALKDVRDKAYKKALDDFCYYFEEKKDVVMINAKEAKIRTEKQLKIIEEEKEKERRAWEDVTSDFKKKVEKEILLSVKHGKNEAFLLSRDIFSVARVDYLKSLGFAVERCRNGNGYMISWE